MLIVNFKSNYFMRNTRRTVCSLALGMALCTIPIPELQASEITGESPVELLEKSQVSVTGLLTDASGNPIPGVTVLVKGTTNGVLSDVDGRYVIKAPEGSLLTFSFIGFETEERRVTADNRSINIRMMEKTTLLDDVIVVGFGQQKKESVVGAISSVKPEAFKLPTSSVLSLPLWREGYRGLLLFSVLVNQAVMEPISGFVVLVLVGRMLVL